MNGTYEHEAARIRLGVGLRCGVHNCECPAVVGTAEPDLDYPGLWLLLPLCAECERRLSEADPETAYDAIHLADR
jgi:hypothetical protein